MSTSSKKRRAKKRRRKPRIGDFPLANGKFSGKPIRMVPMDYLEWALTAKGISDADKWAISKYLEGRRAKWLTPLDFIDEDLEQGRLPSLKGATPVEWPELEVVNG